MRKLIRKIFHPENLVKPSLIQGGLPSAKEAYTRCWRLAWPSALESVLVALVSFVDTVMVGGLGPAAISTVGVTNQPKFLLMAMILSLNVGVTAVVARRKGEGDIFSANRALKQAVMVSVSLSLLVTVFGNILAPDLLRLAGAQADYINDSVDYFRIIITGQFFGCVGLTINAAQRGFGNTKISMRSNLVANLINVLLNYLLINGIWLFPRLEVRGAAIATAVGSMVAFGMALSSVLTHHADRLSLINDRAWKFDKQTMKGIFNVSSSAFVEQLFIRFGFFTYASMVARLGTIPFATHQICMNIIQISFAFADGFGVASTSLVGQSLGAKRPDHAMIYGRVGQRYSMCIGIALSVLFLLLRKQLIMIFNTDPTIVNMGAQIVCIIAAISLVQTTQVVISGCLRGAGDSRFVAISSFISIGVIRPGLSYLLCYPIGLGLTGAWLGMFLDQFMRTVLNLWRYKGAEWTKIKI